MGLRALFCADLEPILTTLAGRDGPQAGAALARLDDLRGTIRTFGEIADRSATPLARPSARLASAPVNEGNAFGHQGRSEGRSSS
jgi:hypothetical protein